MFFCDSTNLIFRAKFFLAFIIAIVGGGLFFLTSNVFVLVVCLILLLIIVFGIHPEINNKSLTKQSIDFAKTNPEFNSHLSHHGIIFLRYENMERQEYTVDCIKILCEGLKTNGQNYKIYECKIPSDFDAPYKDPKVTHLWVIGHGKKDRLSFDNSQKLEYSTLPLVESKEFIAQLHCSNGDGDPLPIVNKAKSQYYSNYYRVSYQNRCYIIKKLRDFQMTNTW